MILAQTSYRSIVGSVDHEHYMRVAMATALEGCQRDDEPPFGAVIVRDNGEIVARTHDCVRRNGDLSAHAETLAVKQACALLGPDLSDCTLYTTCEPCPMCFTTAWLAHMRRIVFGSRMQDVFGATGGRQRELHVSIEEMNAFGGGVIELVADVLREECTQLFDCYNYNESETNLNHDGRGATAVIFIDFQRDFCSPGGYVDRQAGIDWVLPVLPKARQLLDAARAAGHLIIHTREGYAADLSDCFPKKLERSNRAGAKIGAAGPMGQLLIRGEHGHDFIDLLKPLPSEIVIDKASYGAFHRTRLGKILRAHNVTTLTICGVTADVCVHTTLREATDRGFHCYYVRDAISTFDTELRAACEKMVLAEGGIWGELVTVDELIKDWMVRDENQLAH